MKKKQAPKPRLAPPLVIERDDLDHGIDVVLEVLG